MHEEISDQATLREADVAGFPAIIGRPEHPRAGAPPAMFLHGAFADHVCFRRWVRRFEQAGFEAVAPSRRGRLGVGPAEAKSLTFQDYVEDTLAVIDALGRSPVIVGHSLGGLVAQRVGELGRARAVALIAPAPPGMLTAQAVALPRFAPNLPRIITGRPFIVGNGACSVLALNRVPEADRPAIHAHLTRESGKVYRSMMFGTVRIDASKVTVPVFVAGGDDDRIISTRLLAKTARHYGVTPHVYEGHGHWILEEPGWESVADDILQWLTTSGL
jgi:pimeloyl-ACP methyl ester carboxylesterase